jgi:C-terminal processing protease CtpA/Prc
MFSGIARIVLPLWLAACASSRPGTIGAALGQTDEHRLFVRATPEGQGAARAGIVPGDEILFLDGKSVRAMSPEEIRRGVRGDVGSTLVVTLVRGGQTMEVKIVRTPLLADTKEEKTR